jgi:glycosyltransferase involved in cell wall biosynthesis
MLELMRILVVTNLYPSARNPSFGTFVQARVDALRNAGAEVTVVANLDARTHGHLVRKYASLGIRAVTVAVRSVFARRPPQVVEAHIAYPTGAVAWIAAAVCRAPLVLFAHGSDVTEIAVRSRVHRAASRWLMRRAALVVVNSEHLAQVVRSRFPDAGDVVEVQSPGIDLKRFGDSREVERRGLLFVGRLVPQKGVDVLLDALGGGVGDLQSTPLRVLGDGPEGPRLEQRAADLGLDVAFLGPGSPERVAEEMQTARVVVVPSNYEEPLGLVALEGMAAGAIVVASAAGGLVSIVEHGLTGFLAAPGDSASLAHGIREALNASADPPRAAALRASGARRAAEHDLARIAVASIHRYRELVA